MCGLAMHLPVLALRLAPSAEPVRHMTLNRRNILRLYPAEAYPPEPARFSCRCAISPKAEGANTCTHYSTKEAVLQGLKRLKRVKGVLSQG